MKHALPLLTALALSACTATTFNVPIVSGGPIREDGRAMIDQPTRVGMLVVTPKALIEDSRCPINARCVWAGRVVLETRIDGPGWRQIERLTLGQPLGVRGTSVTLTSAEPNKLAGAPPVRPSAYMFGFQGGR